jgi:hypothetical protein
VSDTNKLCQLINLTAYFSIAAFNWCQTPIK